MNLLLYVKPLDLVPELLLDQDLLLPGTDQIKMRIFITHVNEGWIQLMAQAPCPQLLDVPATDFGDGPDAGKSLIDPIMREERDLSSADLVLPCGQLLSGHSECHILSPLLIFPLSFSPLALDVP